MVIEEEPQKVEPVIIYGSEGINVQLATCCLPIPGDTIIGELNMTRGLVVHNAECLHAKKLVAKEPEKWINVDWGEELNRSFDCYLRLLVVEEKGHSGQSNGRNQRIRCQYHRCRNGNAR